MQRLMLRHPISIHFEYDLGGRAEIGKKETTIYENSLNSRNLVDNAYGFKNAINRT